MYKIQSSIIEEAACLLKEGKLVAFPTETVYGLGAAIFCEEAIAEIFRIKGRPADNPLIAHISSLNQLSQIVVDPPESFYHLAKEFFPGPLTVVLKKHPAVPLLATAGLDTIGVRMPLLEVTRTLIELVGCPLVAPSANLSGKPSATKAEHVLEDFGDKIAALVEGSCQYGLESTVLVLEPSPVLLRPGQISREELEQVLGQKIAVADERAAVQSPGMKYRHYAPAARVKVFFSKAQMEEYLAEASACKRHIFEAKATTLYAELRAADRMGCAEAVVLCTSSDAALLNRLMKASK